MSCDLSKLPELITRHPRSPTSLIMALQEIQREYHYLPADALRLIARTLDVPLSKVFSVATFYNAFSLEKQGENVIRVCKGTACHIRGAGLIQEQLESLLGLEAGETTPDGKYTLEVVACVGACAMAPVVIVNGKYHAAVNVADVKKLLKAR